MSSPLGTHGSYYDRMRESVGFSETKRCEVAERSEQVRRKALNTLARRAALQRHGPPDTVRGDVYAAQCINEDSDVKLAIGGEQWGCRLATMYGILHIAETMDSVLREIRRTNVLLEGLTINTDDDDNNHL